MNDSSIFDLGYLKKGKRNLNKLGEKNRFVLMICHIFL